MVGKASAELFDTPRWYWRSYGRSRHAGWVTGYVAPPDSSHPGLCPPVFATCFVNAGRRLRALVPSFLRPEGRRTITLPTATLPPRGPLGGACSFPRGCWAPGARLPQGPRWAAQGDAQAVPGRPRRGERKPLPQPGCAPSASARRGRSDRQSSGKKGKKGGKSSQRPGSQGGRPSAPHDAPWFGAGGRYLLAAPTAGAAAVRRGRGCPSLWREPRRDKEPPEETPLCSLCLSPAA